MESAPNSPVHRLSGVMLCPGVVPEHHISPVYLVFFSRSQSREGQCSQGTMAKRQGIASTNEVKCTPNMGDSGESIV